MLEALRRTGWHNYSLFVRDDGLLFGYFEAEESFAASLAGMAGEDVNARWQEFMAPYLKPRRDGRHRRARGRKHARVGGSVSFGLAHSDLTGY